MNQDRFHPWGLRLLLVTPTKAGEVAARKREAIGQSGLLNRAGTIDADGAADIGRLQGTEAFQIVPPASTCR